MTVVPLARACRAAAVTVSRGISSWHRRTSACAIASRSASDNGGDRGIGARDDDDVVLRVLAHGDGGNATRAVDTTKQRGVDPGVLQGLAQLGAETVVADRADERHVPTGFRGGDGLVAAFASRRGGKGSAEQRFSRSGGIWTLTWSDPC